MKKWYKCPNCNKKLIKYNDGAYSNGIFLLCKKCGQEVEIKVNNKSLN